MRIEFTRLFLFDIYLACKRLLSSPVFVSLLTTIPSKLLILAFGVFLSDESLVYFNVYLACYGFSRVLIDSTIFRFKQKELPLKEARLLLVVFATGLVAIYSPIVALILAFDLVCENFYISSSKARGWGIVLLCASKLSCFLCVFVASEWFSGLSWGGENTFFLVVMVLFLLLVVALVAERVIVLSALGFAFLIALSCGFRNTPRLMSFGGEDFARQVFFIYFFASVFDQVVGLAVNWLGYHSSRIKEVFVRLLRLAGGGFIFFSVLLVYFNFLVPVSTFIITKLGDSVKGFLVIDFSNANQRRRLHIYASMVGFEFIGVLGLLYFRVLDTITFLFGLSVLSMIPVLYFSCFNKVEK